MAFTRSINGIDYHFQTDERVISTLEGLKKLGFNGMRVRIQYGNRNTGESGLLPNNLEGYVVAGGGKLYIYKTKTAKIGWLIKDQFIVRIASVKGNVTIYEHKTFKDNGLN